MIISLSSLSPNLRNSIVKYLAQSNNYSTLLNIIKELQEVIKTNSKIINGESHLCFHSPLKKLQVPTSLKPHHYNMCWETFSQQVNQQFAQCIDLLWIKHPILKKQCSPNYYPNCKVFNHKDKEYSLLYLSLQDTFKDMLYLLNEECQTLEGLQACCQNDKHALDFCTSILNFCKDVEKNLLRLTAEYNDQFQTYLGMCEEDLSYLTLSKFKTLSFLSNKKID